jgi:hypothetical protein
LVAAGCSSSSSSPPVSKPSQAPRPAITLKAFAHTRNATAPIPAGGGWEGATWSSPRTATVRFWRYSAQSRKWKVIGHSRYPVYPGFGCLPKVAGAALDNGTHATYIVGGCFTGDGTLNTTVFADGPRHWGLVVQRGTRLVASGQPGTRRDGPSGALFYNERITRGVLETIVGGNNFFSNGAEGLYPLRTFWRWSGTAFERIRDNAFTAKPAAAPPRTRRSLPRGRCPTDGSFQASIGLSSRANGQHTEQPVRIELFPPADVYPAQIGCRVTLPTTFPMTVLAAHTSAHILFIHRGHITNRRWITAPPWFLLHGNGYDQVTFFPSYVAAGRSPYVVPTSLKVNEFLSYLHEPNQPHYGRRVGGVARPDHGVVTFRSGKLVGLAISAIRVLHPAADARATHKHKRHHHLRRHHRRH